MNRERGHILVIILGIVLMLFVIGFFRSNAGFWGSVNYKKLLRLPCGVTVNAPDLKRSEKVSFPLMVEGYINGCGWEAEGLVAGTAQVFDGAGHAVTKAYDLAIPSDSTDMPMFFSAELFPSAAPTTDAGTLLIRSNAGLLSSIPVAF